MAKKSLAPQGKLAGKSVAFVGDLGYYKHALFFTAAVTESGGGVVDAETSVPDFLVVGRGRGGKSPGQATALLKKHPSIQSLDIPAFCNLLLPDRDELVQQIRSGWMCKNCHGAKHDTHWEMLEAILKLAGATIDLGGESFRGANCYGAHLRETNLDGCDLRETKLQYAHLPALRGAKFDKAEMPHVYLFGAEDCSFRNADMTEAWFDDVHQWNRTRSYAGNDFSGAKITKASGRKTEAAGSIFRDADLSGGQFEESNFAGSDFSGANLTQARLHKSNLQNAKLVGANCFRADLRNASLVNADLRKADFREAVLTGADLSGARIDGAGFAGANLAGAKTNGVDASKAKNFSVQQSRSAGPKMKELAKVAAQSRMLDCSVELDLGNGERAVLNAHGRSGGGRFYPGASSTFLRGDDKWGDNERHDASTFEQGMLDAAVRWSRGTVQLDTVAAKGSKCPLKGKPLLELARAAWCEACGVDAADIQKRAEADAAASEGLGEVMLSELKGGAAGITKWNARPKHERMKLAKLGPVDLSGVDLTGADLSDVDFKRANFENGNLKEVKILHGSLEKANFAGADLSGAEIGMGKGSGASFENARLHSCKLQGFTLRNANFGNAILTGAQMSFVDLRGADLSTAVLGGVSFEHVDFDEKTKLPAGFVPPPEMTWKGPGPHPGAAKIVPRAKKAGAMSFDAFLKGLANKVLSAKLAKATSMLKAERFQLFAEVKPESVVGIVKSQTSHDLVYSCRLCSDGSFSCCTQNLKPCGGLQGSLCKHLLVLIVGLTKAGELDPATVDNWVNASKAHKPAIDKDVMSETFLRYKGAEAGEVDWRPTETIPEDYYAL